jgi:hypothetical protein
MERTGIVAAAVADGAAQLEAGVWRLAAVLLTGSLLEGERALQQVARQVMGAVESAILAGRAAGPEGEAAGCPQCGRRLHLVGRERGRTVLGLVGEYRFARPTFHCANCHAGHAPLDTVLGLGEGQLSPGLAQVVCGQAQKDSFAEARKSVQSDLGVEVDEETIRRVAEGVGRLIEHDQADRAQWHVPDQAVPARLVVEMDGVHTPLRDGYHETKVGRVAALGPTVREDPETGRQTLVLQPSSFCAGLESSEAFFPRLAREAWRAGLTRGVREVIVLGDGARWIWHQARTQFSPPGVDVIEIVDFYHASEQLHEVASAVYGVGTLAAESWWAAQRHALLHEGAVPVLAALQVLLLRPDLPEAARTVVRRNLTEYFTVNAARLAYPLFIARHLPIGSGAVESGCKQLITQRAKGAGMRWSAPGAQYIANLRALHHSAHARWDAFWASKPLTRLRLLPPPVVAQLSPATAAGPLADAVAAPLHLPAAASPTPAPPDPSISSTEPPAAAAQRIATAGKPWAKGKGYWRRIAVCHTRSA